MHFGFMAWQVDMAEKAGWLWHARDPSILASIMKTASAKVVAMSAAGVIMMMICSAALQSLLMP